ncbi:MAG: FAD-binding oxidoreductase [Burkholderiaceae bacterium]|jgi:FAD/FMN-containing dehydrogenase|nr:FAD-binding oxidoreductase [Burkholderiaceae bacterium]
MTAPDDLLSALRAICGSAHVLQGDGLDAYEADHRGRARGHALAVALPGSVAEVAAVVKTCARQRVAIVPQGGNTGLSVGSVPDASGRQLVLSLKRLRAVRGIDAANLTLTAEAGCLLQQAQEAAAAAALLLPLSLAAEGSCTLGGNLATNAGGTQVLRYGNARDLCLGLEVVTAQGEIWNGLTGLRKDNTGYDLRDLFVGSEGTLGIITAATLKLFAQPATQLTAWIALPGLQAAVDLLALARAQLGAALTGFEVMNQFSLHLVHTHWPALRMPPWQQTPWCALLQAGFADSPQHARARFEALLQTALAQTCAQNAVLAETGAQAAQFWRVRENIPAAQRQEGLNIKHDISLPTSAIPAFAAETGALLAREIVGVRLVTFGHLGDGNLHYNVQAPEGLDTAEFLRAQEPRINALVYDAVARFGGSFSAEHGIGSLKLGAMRRYKSPVALQLMRAIKTALDPQGILNPGRVLPP